MIFLLFYFKFHYNFYFGSQMSVKNYVAETLAYISLAGTTAW